MTTRQLDRLTFTAGTLSVVVSVQGQALQGEATAAWQSSMLPAGAPQAVGTAGCLPAARKRLCGRAARARLQCTGLPLTHAGLLPHFCTVALNGAPIQPGSSTTVTGGRLKFRAVAVSEQVWAAGPW